MLTHYKRLKKGTKLLEQIRVLQLCVADAGYLISDFSSRAFWCSFVIN